MKSKLAVVAVFAALTLWCAGQAYAQQQKVQITSGPMVQNVSGDSVTIAWSTSVPASAVVKYGTDPNNLSQTAKAPWGGTDHTVTIHGLQQGKTYHYYVTSGEASGTGTSVSSQVAQFTAGQQGSQPAAAAQSGTGESNVWIMAGPIIQNLTDKSARVWWRTSRKASTILRYGTDPSNFSQPQEKPWGLLDHTVDLSNLNPDTTYYVEIDTEGGQPMTRQSFKTESTQQAQSQFKVTHGPVIESLGPNSAVIAWTTNAPSSSIVLYGTDPNSLSQRAEAAWGQTTHRVTVNGLQPNHHYWFEIQSGQAQGTGQMAQSNPFPATTVPSGQAAMNFNTQ